MSRCDHCPIPFGLPCLFEERDRCELAKQERDRMRIHPDLEPTWTQIAQFYAVGDPRGNPTITPYDGPGGGETDDVLPTDPDTGTDMPDEGDLPTDPEPGIDPEDPEGEVGGLSMQTLPTVERVPSAGGCVPCNKSALPDDVRAEGQAKLDKLRSKKKG